MNVVFRARALVSLVALAALAAHVHPRAQGAVVARTPAADDEAAKIAAIERAVDERRVALGIPGVALAVVKDDRVLVLKGFGLRDVDASLPVTPDTLFAIGSATKAFTTLAAIRSADDGRLSLDDSPRKFVPYFKLRDPQADAAVTLRDLMSHRTGLGRTDLAMATNALSREELIRVAGEAKATAPFRQKFQYQNLMFTAAGEAVGRANGTTWERYVKERILTPLGMKRTVVTAGDALRDRDHSLGYDHNPETGETRTLERDPVDAAAPAGSISSSAREMAIWLRFLLAGGEIGGKRFVSEAGFAQLFTPNIGIAPGFAYGLGWFLDDRSGRHEVYHGGNIEGFNAMVAMWPAERLGVVMLSNVSASPLDAEIRSIVSSTVLGPAPGRAAAASAAQNDQAKPKPTATDASRSLVGYYDSAQGTGRLVIALTGDVVSLTAGNQPPRALADRGDGTFGIDGLPDVFFVTATRGADGTPTGVVVHQPDHDASFTRADTSVALPSADELMGRVVAAYGGEANLRRHTASVTLAHAEFETEGVTGDVVMTRRAPAAATTRSTLVALGRPIGTMVEYFDGSRGGEIATFGTPATKSGSEIDDARVESAFYEPLDWKTSFASVRVDRTARVGDEPVFVVVKTPAAGHPVTDYVSAKSGLVVRRETIRSAGFSGMTIPYTDDYSDFRTVDGVVVPFKTVTSSPFTGPVTTTVASVTFDPRIDSAVFARPQDVSRPSRARKFAHARR